MRTAQRWTLAAAVLGSGIVFLDSTVVTVALPRIGRDLPAQYLGVLEGQNYVYATYLLTLSALLILAGAVNDHYGRRRMFAFAFALNYLRSSKGKPWYRVQTDLPDGHCTVAGLCDVPARIRESTFRT